MTHRIGLVLLAVTTSAACSERTLSAEQAASLITALEQFKREAHFTIRSATTRTGAGRAFARGRRRQCRAPARLHPGR